MTIETTDSGSHVIVKVIGRMDAASSAAFEQECSSWAEKGARALIVDMTELTYVSSLGLRSFVGLAQQFQAKGASFRLAGMSGLVKQVFEITRLVSIFSIYDSLSAATADL